jgi:hypothetical protein
VKGEAHVTGICGEAGVAVAPAVGEGVVSGQLVLDLGEEVGVHLLPYKGRTFPGELKEF